MRTSVVTVALVAALACVSGALAQDPAQSWMAYAVTKTGHLGKRITRVNATWKVPSNPALSGSDGSAPGWWWGIEPEPAVDLIQPILAWGDGFPQFTIFNGYFQWDDGDWQQSRSGTVKPGDVIHSSVTYQSDDSYTMWISSGDFQVSTNIACEDGRLFTDLYFVFEHQPMDCRTLPTSNIVTFVDINVEVDGKPITPTWTSHLEVPACKSEAHVLSPSSISLTWDSSGSADDDDESTTGQPAAEPTKFAKWGK